MEKGQDSFIEDFYDKHGVTKLQVMKMFKMKLNF